MNNELWFNKPPGGGGYQIERSLRFNSDDSAYLSRTPASAGNRKTWTLSFWVKRGASTGSDIGLFSTYAGSNPATACAFNSNDGITFYNYSGSYQFQLITTQVFRDYSSWYHLVFVVDTTQATASDRVKLYVNGVRVTTFSTETYPSQNVDTDWNSTTEHQIGNHASYFHGYLASVFLIDGQALDPTSFGLFDDNGVWQPKAYTGSYGTNGFHLPFNDNSTAAALGTDTSGNGNDWTVNNISVAAGADNDSLVDVPTNGTETDTGLGAEVRGNYASANPLDKYSTIQLANGNLDISSSEANWRSVRGSFGMSSGKWYWEITITNSGYNIHGIGLNSAALTNYPGVSAGSYGWDYNGNLVGGNSTGSASAYGTVISFAFDADTGRLDLYNDGVLESGYFSGLPSGTYFPMFGLYGTIGLAQVNFGQRPFAYTAPSGFKALNTANLPTPTIADGSTAINVVLDTGANILTAAQGAIGGSADLLWIKDRANSNNHQLIDTVRGGTATLQSNTTAAETTYSAPSGSSVAWTWDAGSSTVTNNDGTITSQVRANPSAGFSIVTYTGNSTVGATVGHGLGVAPQLIIIKARNNVSGGNWQVYHQAIGNTKYLELNSTSAAGTSSNRWNNTTPSSTVFTLGSDSDLNGSLNYVAYCFAPVEGYSAFGSYEGNGSGDGPFVYTGFRPRWILFKCSTAVAYWGIYDAARNTYNAVNLGMYPNDSIAEVTDQPFDFLSNGFKVRGTTAFVNSNADTYVWAAFAEHPFQYARAR